MAAMSLCCGTSDQQMQQMLMKGEDDGEATETAAVVQLRLPKDILLLTFSDWSVWLQTSLSFTAVIYVWLLPWLQTTAWAQHAKQRPWKVKSGNIHTVRI